MPDYSKAKIYKIVCDETGLCYIGSTCETLSQRLSKHTGKYRLWIKDNSKPYCTSYIIFENDNYYIELIELYPCTCIDELTSREGWHQRNEVCVNRRHEGRTKQQYRQDNAVQLAEQKQKYREQNKVQIAERNQKYHEQNKDIINQKRRDNRLAKKILSASIV
jgi:hypothetical protein